MPAWQLKPVNKPGTEPGTLQFELPNRNRPAHADSGNSNPSVCPRNRTPVGHLELPRPFSPRVPTWQLKPVDKPGTEPGTLQFELPNGLRGLGDHQHEHANETDG